MGVDCVTSLDIEYKEHQKPISSTCFRYRSKKGPFAVWAIFEQVFWMSHTDEDSYDQ